MRYTLTICLTLIAMCFCSTTDKEAPDWTGTTQGEYVLDTIKAQIEEDSVDNYMRHWYAVCDTNSDGDIDDIK